MDVTGSCGTVTFQIKEEEKKEESNPKEEKKNTPNETANSGCGKMLGRIFALLVGVAVVVIIVKCWNLHHQQIEAQHQREIAIEDSIRREAKAKKLAEEERKRNYRPAAPKPSKPDVEVLGLTVGVKKFSKKNYLNDVEVLYFDRSGYLTKIQKGESYVVTDGKVISRDGENYE